MVDTYSHLIFEVVAKLPVSAMVTPQHFRSVPPSEYPWQPVETGFVWGDAWETAWFKGRFQIDSSSAEHPLYIRARTGGIETLLWVNENPRGIFTHPTEGVALGGHHTLFLCPSQPEGTVLDIALESYAGHPIPGTQPFGIEHVRPPNGIPGAFRRTYESLQVMTRRDDVKDFVFDLLALCQLWERLPDESFRKGAVARGLAGVFDVVLQSPDEHAEEVWRPALQAGRDVMRLLLEARNGSSAPKAALIGHSHMDTAWLWPIDETIRKCARTYANALSLMEQYPEYRFIQSTPLHVEWMRLHYPSIFQAICERVSEGRWEPNGGMWVECDCNLTAGESMIRQFIKGQSFTRKHFNYRADTFWLPDTFGYSAAIPQILHGCGISYFLTTKLTWNETNTFPFDTFWWHGLDGSRVLTHFNDIHCWPDPATLINKIEGGGPKDFRSVENYILHKDVNDRRLISFGFGDGGGGPQFEMLEMARRCTDLEGCPKSEYTTVSDFMKDLEKSSHQIPNYHGELYFEGHRGSLNQMAAIKRGNRKAELALRDVEFFIAVNEMQERPAPRTEAASLYDILLINQFHDILPGTSIPKVHERATRELAEVQAGAEQLCIDLIGVPSPEALTIWNTLSWPRDGILSIPDPGEDLRPADPSLTSQKITTLSGQPLLIISGLVVPALAGRKLQLAHGFSAIDSVFEWSGDRLITPTLQVTFDDAGFISSLLVRAIGREICGRGHPLNTLLCGEDVPESWDNWNIDADQARKLRPQRQLLAREIVTDGPLQFRLRSTYRIGTGSTLRQDMVFFSDSMRIDFETEVDWRERHQLLKVAFDVNLSATLARQEIQFGHIARPTRPRNSYDQAMFEVCNHKWSDISENRFGVAMLNDCKYGISIEGSEMRLSLLRSGCMPDPQADNGIHSFTYALVPHSGGFQTETVIRPAYELNIPLRTGEAAEVDFLPLLEIDDSNLIVEAVKPAENGKGCIIRIYEAEQASGKCKIRFRHTPSRVFRTNMLEEPLEEISLHQNIMTLSYRAFEIISLRVLWHGSADNIASS